MAQIVTWFEQDINKPVKVKYLDGNVFSLDNNGNRIGVRVYDGTQTVTLSGSISASVIRADGATVAVSGTISGNSAYVDIPQSALAVPGVASIVIKNTSGGQTVTLCAIVANVYQSSTDSAVDPGTIIPSIDALIAAINAAVQSIPMDWSSLNNVLLSNTVTAEKVLLGMVPNASGVIATSASSDSYVYRVEPGTYVDYAKCSNDDTYQYTFAFYTDEPFLDSVSYDNARHSTPTSSYSNIATGIYVPDGCNWLVLIVRKSEAGQGVPVVRLLGVHEIIGGTRNLYHGGDITITSATGVAYMNFDTPMPAGQYAISGIVSCSNSSFGGLRINIYQGSSTVNVTPLNSATQTERRGAVFTVAEPFTRIRIMCAASASEAVGYTGSFKNIQLELATHNTDYIKAKTAVDLVAREKVNPVVAVNESNLWTLGDIDIPSTNGYITAGQLGKSLMLNPGTYTVSANAYSEYRTDNVVRLLFKVGTDNQYVDLTADGQRRSATFTITAYATLTRLQGANTTASAAGYGGYFRNAQIVSGSSDKAYNPYITAVDSLLRLPNVYPSGANDYTTDSTNISAAIGNAGYCHLSEGVFKVRVIGIPGGATRPIMIEGSGKGTIIEIENDNTFNYGIRISNNCIIRNLTLRSANTSYTPADPYTAANVKHGIRIAATTGTSHVRAVIENVSIENFSGAGIFVDATGQGTDDGSHIINTWVDNCGAGVWLNTHAEYCRVSTCNFTHCWYGAINDGGNNNFTACNFSRCKFGFFMDNTSGNLSNNTHGQAVSCIFNHMDTDSSSLGTGWGIYLVGATSGFQFVGCQMFYSQIYLKNCKGIAFNGLNVGKVIEGGSDLGIKFQIDHSDSSTYGTLLCNSIFLIRPRFVLPDGDTKIKLAVANCYTREGTAITL